MDPSSFSGIGWTLVSIAALFAAIDRIDNFIKRRSGNGKENREVGPQPFVVEAVSKFVHEKEFKEHTAHNTKTHNEIFNTLRTQDVNLRASLKIETDALLEKVTAVAKQNSAQEAKQDMTNQRLIQMDGKLDRLIERKKP